MNPSVQHALGMTALVGLGLSLVVHVCALSGIDVKAKRPVYVGRKEAASPATGSARTHLKEQADLVDRALTLG